ncbi:Levodione reductase [Sphaceloma murrayae]|uniref:Levodione reductase n=1 Tax=Sphaceloma murrayae TaxID=2082308 RepID=A0A2K1QPJ5_9PEZI|nr:Levodione reductase [Sphaceloma murrayae]
MSGKLQGRTAFITGASSGLGRAIALRFASEGANVLCTDLSPTIPPAPSDTTDASPHAVRGDTPVPTHDLITSLHGPSRSFYTRCDVTSSTSISAAVQFCVEKFGRVDIVVSSAGIIAEGGGEMKRVHETEVEHFDRDMAVNARGVWLTCKFGIGQMLKQSPLAGTKGRGWVVNMASVMGLVAQKGISSYCATKGAVVQMSKAMALEYAPERIHVNSLCPGYVNSALTQSLFANAAAREYYDALHPLGGMAEDPDVIAKAAVFLASDDAEWVTGQALAVEGGYTAQ